MNKAIIIVVGLSVILGILFWRFGSNIYKPSDQPQQINLTYWSVNEDEGVIKAAVEEYQKQNPKVTITVVKQSPTNYRTRVQTQIRQGSGPDIFRIHNSWLPMLKTDLSSAPQDILPAAEYQSAFYPILKSSFVSDNQIFGSSYEVNGLALFVNEELLSAVGSNVPKTWQEFISAAVKTTVKDQSGQIYTAGAAMGTTSNVDFWPDIVGLLLVQQPGVNFNNLASAQVAEVLRFYTGFVIDPTRKTWDITMPSSTEAFIQGRLAFYFTPSYKASEITQLNPNLKFKVVPVPQLPGSQIAWGSFWGEGVSVRSKHQKEAWKFVKFLTSEDGQLLLASQSKQARPYAFAYSRVELAPEIINDPILGAYIAQGPFYKSWYLASQTMDNGLNDEMIKVWGDGINAILNGQDVNMVLTGIGEESSKIYNKYMSVLITPSVR